MGKKSGPPAPDYTAAAQKQAEASERNVTMQTWANRADQTNPWGSTSWTTKQVIDPATGKPVTQWSENTTLDPRLQDALNSQISLQGSRSDLANSLMPRAQQEFGREMDWSNATPWASTPQGQQLDAITGAYGPGFGATTSAFGFGGPRQQRIDTSRQGTPDLQTGLDFSGVQGVGNAADTRQRAEDAIYKSATSRLDPQWQQRQQQMETDLANRGISQNSEAYTRAMDDFNRSRNDAYSQAQMNAITGGGAEAQRDYSMNLGLRQQQVGELEQAGQFRNQALGQAFGFGNTARQQQLGAQQQAFEQGLQGGNYDLARQQQAFQQQSQLANLGLTQEQQAFQQQQAAGGQNFQQQMALANYQNQLRQNQLAEEMQRRGFSLNEINAIISGQQVNTPQFQGYNQAGQAQAPDYMGAANAQYNAALNSSNAQQAGFGSLLSAGTQLGSAFMFSDARVKRVVRRIGTHPRGFGLYRFRYIGERGTRVGVIAQEVKRYAPELVRSVRGVLQVDYAGI